MPSTVPLSVKCVPKRKVSASSVEAIAVPVVPVPPSPITVMVVILEVKVLVMSCALNVEYVRVGDEEVIPLVPFLRDIFVTCTHPRERENSKEIIED